MRIAVIGVNHNKTPIEIREKVSFTETKKIESVDYLQDAGISEVIILSTCNRSEIYIVSDNVEEHIEYVKKYFRDFFYVDCIEEYLFCKVDKEAVWHIYNVASGLDSIVLGEDQILGQVKDALLSSMEVGGSKKILNKLFREAITAAKEIKNNLGISDIPLSTSYIGIKFLKENMSSFKGKKALIVGTGKISSLALRYLQEEEMEKIYITNRTHGKLKEICTKNKDLIPIEYENRYEIIKDIDILISATASHHTVIKYHNMPDVHRNLYILDLALPRDVDRKIENLAYVKLYDIDDLKKISEKNKKKREELCNIAIHIIEKSIEEFYQWIKEIKFDPVIKSLNERCREIEDDTFEYIERKLDLDHREKKIIEKMIKSSLKRLIREPINNLKEIKQEDDMNMYINMINKLFDF